MLKRKTNTPIKLLHFFLYSGVALYFTNKEIQYKTGLTRIQVLYAIRFLVNNGFIIYTIKGKYGRLYYCYGGCTLSAT